MVNMVVGGISWLELLVNFYLCTGWRNAPSRLAEQVLMPDTLIMMILKLKLYYYLMQSLQHLFRYFA